jgi:hypothetical protein
MRMGVGGRPRRPGPAVVSAPPGTTRPPYLLTLDPKSRAAAVSKAMAGELRDLVGRERGERAAAGTRAAAAAPETAPSGGQG